VGPPVTVTLEPVTAESWRAVAAVETGAPWMATTSHYLLLCAYGGVWQPLAITCDGEVAGFVMWGFDEDDGHHWIGGFAVDRAWQGRGVGTAALRLLLDRLRAEGATGIALTYDRANTGAARLYRSFGFVEDGEADGEILARLAL
jgi:diamine N-acetyltransferase